jgi:hypothetical protein
MSEKMVKKLRNRNKQLSAPKMTSEGLAKLLVPMAVEAGSIKAAAAVPGQTPRMKAKVGRRVRRLKKRVESARGMFGG